MDTNKEDFDISRLKRFVWNEKPWIATLILGATALVLCGLIVTIFLARVQPEGFWRSFSGTFSNIMGPVVGVVAALFGLLAFYVQYKANMDIRRQFAVGRLSDQFHRYIDGIERTQDNLRIFGVVEKRGRVCILHWGNEIDFIFKLVKGCFPSDFLKEYGKNYDEQSEFYFTVVGLAFFGQKITEQQVFSCINIENANKDIDDRILELVSVVNGLKDKYIANARKDSESTNLEVRSKYFSVLSWTSWHAPLTSGSGMLMQYITLIKNLSDFIESPDFKREMDVLYCNNILKSYKDKNVRFMLKIYTLRRDFLSK